MFNILVSQILDTFWWNLLLFKFCQDLKNFLQPPKTIKNFKFFSLKTQRASSRVWKKVTLKFLVVMECHARIAITNFSTFYLTIFAIILFIKIVSNY